MKKLFIVLFALALLSACSDSGTEPKESEEWKKLEGLWEIQVSNHRQTFQFLKNNNSEEWIVHHSIYENGIERVRKIYSADFSKESSSTALSNINDTDIVVWYPDESAKTEYGTSILFEPIKGTNSLRVEYKGAGGYKTFIFTKVE